MTPLDDVTQKGELLGRGWIVVLAEVLAGVSMHSRSEGSILPVAINLLAERTHDLYSGVESVLLRAFLDGDRANFSLNTLLCIDVLFLEREGRGGAVGR
jgi:hypothetical protein